MSTAPPASVRAKLNNVCTFLLGLRHAQPATILLIMPGSGDYA
jgi:hypothetical protein